MKLCILFDFNGDRCSIRTGQALLTTAILCLSLITSTASAESQAGETPRQIENAKPGLSYGGVNILLGGFLASETVYRNNNMASDIGTNFSKIPFSNSAGYGMSEYRGTERQSRFSLLAQGDSDSTTHFSGYYELDFLGTSPTSNANESNSYTPRTRNVYMTVDWDNIGFHILAGQSWSLATLNSKGITPRSEYLPQTIDSQYAVGFNWARQWQFRMVKDWDKKYWLALSFENSQTVGIGGSASTGTGNSYQLPAGNLMSSNMSYNGYPDAIAKFALESTFGHYEVYGLARNFQSRYGGTTVATQDKKQNEWTEAIGGGVTVPVYPKLIDISLSGLIGKGIGRYGTTGLSDATYAKDGSLKPLSGAQYLAQLVWHASSEWETYLSYGQEKVNSTAGADYGYGSGIGSSNSGCSTLGGACTPYLMSVTQSNLGFWWSFYKGESGTAKLGTQFSQTEVRTYADHAGFAPKTSENMLFASLRYYPF